MTYYLMNTAISKDLGEYEREADALQVVRALVDRFVGRPLERRTRFTAAQIRAAIGLAFVLYMTYRLTVALVRSAREAARTT